MYDREYYGPVTTMQLGFFGVGEATIDVSSGREERTELGVRGLGGGAEGLATRR